MPRRVLFPFEIRQDAGRWMWRADGANGASQQGAAPSRAAAAACVIRVLATAASGSSAGAPNSQSRLSPKAS